MEKHKITTSEKLLDQLKNKRWIAPLIALGVIIIALSHVGEAVTKLTDLFGIWGRPKPQTDKQVFAAQLKRLQAIQDFFEAKTEFELREAFDLNDMAKYNFTKAAIDHNRLQFTQQAIDKAEEFFKGGNFNLSLKYVHVSSMGGADHSPVLQEIPGKAYRIYCSVKYLQARQELQRLASFTEVPSSIRNKINSFSEALDKNLDILLDVINQDLDENPDRLAHNDDEKSRYAGAATNTYNKASVQLKPLADDVISEIRNYLGVK